MVQLSRGQIGYLQPSPELAFAESIRAAFDLISASARASGCPRRGHRHTRELPAPFSRVRGSTSTNGSPEVRPTCWHGRRRRKARPETSRDAARIGPALHRRHQSIPPEAADVPSSSSGGGAVCAWRRGCPRCEAAVVPHRERVQHRLLGRLGQRIASSSPPRRYVTNGVTRRCATRSPRRPAPALREHDLQQERADVATWQGSAANPDGGASLLRRPVVDASDRGYRLDAALGAAVSRRRGRVASAGPPTDRPPRRRGRACRTPPGSPQEARQLVPG
jgi:hypothetical protein